MIILLVWRLSPISTVMMRGLSPCANRFRHSDGEYCATDTLAKRNECLARAANEIQKARLYLL
jgi:hypothetical protein